MTMNTTTNYFPEFDHQGKQENYQTKGIIRDLIIGIQTDKCTTEVCPRFRFLIDLPEKSTVVIADATTLKNFIAVYGDKLAHWIGADVTVCHSKQDAKRGGIRILPVLE